MFDYLDKFNNLKSDLKLTVSNPQTVALVEELEKEFNVDLASLIMRIMIKEVKVEKLPLVIADELNLGPDQSKDLAAKIQDRILSPAADYLSLKRPVLDPTVAQIIKILNLKFKSDDSQNRFESSLNKYVIGVKDRYSSRRALSDLNLSDKMIDNIFMIVQSIQDKDQLRIKSGLKVEQEVLRKIEGLGHGPSRPEEQPKLLESQDKILELPAAEEIKKIEFEPKPAIEEAAPVPPENLVAALDRLKPLEPEVKPPLKPLEAVKPAINIPPTSGGKIKMSDVKKVKVTGPIDELRYMDLVNFRRLSSDTGEAFEKIRQKLKILSGIDYGRMLEGIKAWRQSPVNKLYLKIFSRAADENKDVKTVIDELEASGQASLTYEEIEALIKFNRSLIF